MSDENRAIPGAAAESSERPATTGVVSEDQVKLALRRVKDPDLQLNIMNARVIALVAQDMDRWQLAGDQLFIDMDLSTENLPAGTRFALGSAVIEVSPQPHTGCQKFVGRFGLDAMKFVNSPLGRQMNLRGINARVVQPGVIRIGDLATKIR